MVNPNSPSTRGYTLREAIIEAQRCLNCKVPQCKKGCPVENEIPDWISQLCKGNIGNAIEIIRRKSNLPGVCGRVCAHERQCEGHCILGRQGKEPVHIGKLERFVADFDFEAGLEHGHIPEKVKGNVAVIGSGPAGLTVASKLSMDGFSVDVYEMEPEAGGVLLYGIPDYRLPKETVRREVKRIEAMGATFITGTTIGRDLTLDELFAKGYDAIFMGTGAGLPRELPIEGKEHPGMMQALPFLRRVQLWQSGHMLRGEVGVSPGDRVIVIGGGNTAMDAARTAVRLGCKDVIVAYRRTINEMRALKSEYHEALEEGVRFLWNAEVKKLIPKDPERLEAAMLTVSGEQEIIKADHVIGAVGSGPAARIVSTTKGIEVDGRGYVITQEEPYGMTTREGVFAGGDVTDRPATVVNAMRDAQKVADGIADYVKAVRLLDRIRQRESQTPTAVIGNAYKV